MSDRERIRRPEPLRVDPVRGMSGVLRGDSTAAASPTGSGVSAGAADPPPNNPFAWPDDDPVSRSLRAGCEVVEQAVRRGFGLGGNPAGPWAAAAGPLGGPWSTGQWVDAMAGAFTLWTKWIDAWSTVARSTIAGGGEPDPGARPPAPPPPSPSPAPSGPPAAGTGALHVTVELRSARAVSVELDLSSGLAPGSSPGTATAFEVHGLVAPAAAAAPPITDVSVAVVDGGLAVALGSLDGHPAGTYAGAVLVAGRARGTLTVRLT
jgi:hypothetical protein